MFKKSLLVALLLSTITVLAISDESVETEMETTPTKCDILYDECISKCGDDATEECSDKCQLLAENCDQENTPPIEE